MSKSKSGKKQRPPKSRPQAVSKAAAGKNNLKWKVIGAVLFITLFTYWPSLQNGWTNWDDPTYVTENPSVIGHQWVELMSGPFSLNYHPITMLSLGIDHLLWGDDAFGFHLTNLLLHLLATMLVFFLVRKLAPDRSWFTAAFAALLFGIHPMHVESVAWISERKDVLYASFFLAGLLTYLKYLEKLAWKWILLTFVLFCCSVLSKAMAVVFPVVLLLIDWYRGSRPLQARVWLEKLPFLAVSLFFGLMAVRIQSQGAIAELEVFSLFQRLTFASYGFVMYLIKAIVPFQMTAFYPYPSVQEAASAFFYAMPLVALAFLAFSVWALKKDRTAFFGIAFYLVTVVLVLQFLSVGRAIIADRYTYLPYVGVFFALGYYLDSWGKGNRRIIMWAGASIFTLFMASMSYLQIKVWRDSETLWTQVIHNFPDEADEAYANRGTFRGKNGHLDEGLSDARRALGINPHHANALSTQANILAAQGQFEAALRSFTLAIQENPDDYKYFQNRAITYASLNRFDEAQRDFTKAIELSKGLVPGVYTNKGFMEINRGQAAEGLRDCQRSYQLQPNDPGANYCMALAYLQMGNALQAKTFGQQAMQLGYSIPDEVRRQLGF